ncbi:hypothetical protein EVY06_19190 [Citrobacter koseri]|uniref:Uncharacterized protein n=1 Tax=Citrobacter koseri TaxID=545 RepID=A0AAQ1A5S5_CITKO|nr:hypothetical protein CEP66_22525 [Citrobacter koseri]QCQ71880.1 hypothetical protein FD428_13065 [Citrobacter sp. TBCP-5362]ATF97012.1 hypothetical protein CO700_08125 [Citrobacter koseri]AVE61282.1 hypothetical protein AM352_17760 [Citrobacter koseri]AVE68196.1 hypothetical protein AM351_10435 [Citrobacter koseri]
MCSSRFDEISLHNLSSADIFMIQVMYNATKRYNDNNYHLYSLAVCTCVTSVTLCWLLSLACL